MQNFQNISFFQPTAEQVALFNALDIDPVVYPNLTRSTSNRLTLQFSKRTWEEATNQQIINLAEKVAEIFTPEERKKFIVAISASTLFTFITYDLALWSSQGPVSDFSGSDTVTFAGGVWMFAVPELTKPGDAPYNNYCPAP